MAYIVKRLGTFDEVYSNVSFELKLWDIDMQHPVNLQNEIITGRVVLLSLKYLSSPNYSSVPTDIYGEFLSDDLTDFVDNVISKRKKVWDTIEKGEITITGVKYRFLNVVRGKVMKDLLYVKNGDQE